MKNSSDPQSSDLNVKDLAISLTNMVARYALPGAVSKLVELALPQLADAVFGNQQVTRALAEGKFTREVVTPTGDTFIIEITEKDHPQIFERIGRKQKLLAQGEPPPSVFSVLVPFEVSRSPSPSLGGGVSILNGIIGVQW